MYSLTLWVFTLGHTLYTILFACSDNWIFNDISQSLFIETFAYQMYTLGHTPYKFVWILDVFLGMNVCDVYRYLNSIVCAITRF